MKADLLSVLHDIDRLRGKLCRTCFFMQSHPCGNPFCVRGHQPAPHADEGCEEWRARVFHHRLRKPV